MSVHKRPERNGKWEVRYRDEAGKQRSKLFPSGRIGERQAKVFDLEVKSRKKAGRALPSETFEGPNLAEIAQEWFDWKKASGRSPEWLRGWASVLNSKILPEIGHGPASALRMTQILHVIEDQFGHASETTRHRYLGYLKSILRFGVTSGYIPSNPLAQWSMPKQRKRDVPLTITDLRKIMDHAAPHLAWAIEVAWNLGTRPGESELFSLLWADVDFDLSQIRIRGTKTRKSDRFVPIQPDFRKRLAEQKLKALSDHVIEYQGRPIKKLRRSLATACRKAGIKYHVIMYDIRHLFGSVLLTGGADLEAVSKLMGHHSTRTTLDAYYHLQHGERERAMGLLPQLNGDTRGETRKKDQTPADAAPCAPEKVSG